MKFTAYVRRIPHDTRLDSCIVIEFDASSITVAKRKATAKLLPKNAFTTGAWLKLKQTRGEHIWTKESADPKARYTIHLSPSNLS